MRMLDNTLHVSRYHSYNQAPCSAHHRSSVLIFRGLTLLNPVYRSDPTEKRAVVDRKYDWMAHVECVNISGTPREYATATL